MDKIKIIYSDKFIGIYDNGYNTINKDHRAEYIHEYHSYILIYYRNYTMIYRKSDHKILYGLGRTWEYGSLMYDDRIYMLSKYKDEYQFYQVGCIPWSNNADNIFEAIKEHRIKGGYDFNPAKIINPMEIYNVRDVVFRPFIGFNDFEIKFIFCDIIKIDGYLDHQQKNEQDHLL